MRREPRSCLVVGLQTVRSELRTSVLDVVSFSFLKKEIGTEEVLKKWVGVRCCSVVHVYDGSRCVTNGKDKLKTPHHSSADALKTDTQHRDLSPTRKRRMGSV